MRTEEKRLLYRWLNEVVTASEEQREEPMAIIANAEPSSSSHKLSS